MGVEGLLLRVLRWVRSKGRLLMGRVFELGIGMV